VVQHTTQSSPLFHKRPVPSIPFSTQQLSQPFSSNHLHTLAWSFLCNFFLAERILFCRQCNSFLPTLLCATCWETILKKKTIKKTIYSYCFMLKLLWQEGPLPAGLLVTSCSHLWSSLNLLSSVTWANYLNTLVVHLVLLCNSASSGPSLPQSLPRRPPLHINCTQPNHHAHDDQLLLSCGWLMHW
jgi:hypothetical protein